MDKEKKIKAVELGDGLVSLSMDGEPVGVFLGRVEDGRFIPAAPKEEEYGWFNDEAKEMGEA